MKEFNFSSFRKLPFMEGDTGIEAGNNSAENIVNDEVGEKTPPSNDNGINYKELFDKASSEIASLKKEFKNLQNEGKTKEQIEAEEKTAKDNLIKELQFKLNKQLVNTEIATVKSTIGYKDNETDINSFIDVLVGDDETKTSTNSKLFSKLLLDAYNKGVNSAKQGNIAKTGDTKTGKVDINSSIIDSIIGINKVPNNSNILDKYKL